MGTIRISGDSRIDMGSGGATAAAFEPGHVRMAAIGSAGAVPSLNALPLVNDGVIDFVDGSADDRLTIVGDLAGSGALDIDLREPSGPADQLLVDGSVAPGSTQTVNVAFSGTLKADGTTDPIPFASVTGDSTADSFVGGDVTGFDAGNFLDLDVLVTSRIDASNATPDVFSFGFDVAGLSDDGALAASIGAGAWSLMTSQIGTWRQRVGVVPPRSADHGVAPFVRTFYDQGDVGPSHRAVNFGQSGNFDHEQLNSGTEVGVNFEPAEGINIGAIAGKSRGKQSLAGDGVGSDKLEADTYGFYATWIAGNGFYLDTSYRAMRFDARIDGAGGIRRTSGAAGAINLETGYPFQFGGGLRLEPQFQYTWTTVDRVFVHGPDAYLRSDDADFHRYRLGLAAWMPIETGAGLVWTPYAAASAVRVDDAKVGYTINDLFRGNVGTEGTSALVEAGVGLQKDGLSVTGGVNWADGGALDSFVGGQVVVRYTW